MPQSWVVGPKSPVMMSSILAIHIKNRHIEGNPQDSRRPQISCIEERIVDNKMSEMHWLIPKCVKQKQSLLMAGFA